MKTYIGIYTGESSKDVLTKSPVILGESPDVHIVDLIYDEGCLEIKETLSRIGIKCRIEAGEGSGFNQVSNLISRICIELKIEEMNKNISQREIFFEIGNLNNILSGAMFLSAFRNGGEVICYTNGKVEHLSKIRPLPNVDRRGYTAQMILDTLFVNDDLDYGTIRDKIYESEIAGMDEEEQIEFFNKHHNTYKVLQNLIKEGWVELDNSSKTYSITPEGNTARVLFEFRNLEKALKPERKNRRVEFNPDA